MITRREAEKIFSESGIKAAQKDHPIYNEAPSVRFINKPSKEKRMKKIQLHHDKHEEDYVEVLSPYTGNNTTSKDGEINEDDKSILFIYLGAAGDFVYISNEFRELIDEDIESIEIEDLEGKISHIDGTLIEVDYGWNGINYYGFVDPKN